MKYTSDEKENIYRYLNQMIDQELDKPEPDMELIDEYNIMLDDIENEVFKPNPAMKAKQLQKLYSEYHNKHTHKIKFQVRWKWSKMVAAVCVIILLIAIPVTIAAINGISPVNLITTLGNKIFSWEVGEAVEFDGITLIRNGEAIKYDSIEDCVKKENLDIYYTSWLPEGVSIVTVILLTTEEQGVLIIKYSDENISFTCEKEISEDYGKIDNQIDINGVTAYYRVLNNKYLANMVLEEKMYSISANHFEEMVNILNGLKKVD